MQNKLSFFRRHSPAFVLFILSAFLGHTSNSQNLQFAKGLSNPPVGGTLESQTVAVDASGNTYVTGYFEGTADFDPGAGTAYLTATGGEDFFFAKYDAAGNYVYAKAIGGTGTEMGRNIAVDGAGNVYLAGSFSGTVDFDPGTGTANLTDASGSHVFFAKYDASGNYVYAKVMGGTGSESPQGIAVDASGNVCLTGYFYNTVDFDPGAGTVNLTSSGSSDIFLAKYDATGNYLYAKRLGGTSMDMTYGIAVDGTGNAYITGSFYNTVDFDPGAGTVNLASAGNDDVFFAKYDASGNYVYAKKIGNTSYDGGRGIAVDGSGNAYVTGSFFGTVDFDPGAGTVSLTATSGSGDIFFARYDALGNYVYAKKIGGTITDQVYDIAVDGSNNAYVTGSLYGTVDFDPGAGTVNLTSAGNEDIFLAKYDAAGNYVYAKRMGGANNEVGRSTGVDGAGNAYVTGTFSGTVDFDPGAGTVNLTSPGTMNNGYLFRLNTSGDYVWAGQLGNLSNTVSNDQGRATIVDGAGNVYVTGSFRGTVDFDPGAGTVNLTSAGGQDIFLAKYDASGNYLYANRFGSTNDDIGQALAVDGAGNIYMTGYFQGFADFDPGAGTAYLSSAGSNDIFLARYDANGNYVYARAVGGFSSDVAHDIAVDGSGNAYITGYFSATADFDPGAGTANLADAGGSDVFFAKYDASGNYVYAKRLGGTNSDLGQGIAVDGAGNVYLTGYFYATGDFDPGAGTVNLSPVGGNDIFLAKYDAAGNYVFAVGIGGTSGEVSNGIGIDGIGNVYITGYFQNTVDFDPGAGTANFTATAGSNDIFLAKYDANGNYVFANQISGAGTDAAQAIAVDGAGNAYITGQFFGTADFDPGAGTKNLTGTGGFTIFLAKYNASGNYAYARAIGGTSNNYGYGIAIDGTGNAYITGHFEGTTDFDPGTGTANITAQNGQDLYLAKYSPPSTLPVTLEYFSARAINQHKAVKLEWRTSTQVNHDYFEVERSNGNQFAAIGRVTGCTNCNTIEQYSFTDTRPIAGRSFYRLKMVDKDGKTKYSQVQAVNLPVDKDMLVYPTVSAGSFLVSVANNDAAKKATVHITDANTRLIFRKTIQLSQGANTIPVDLSDKASGTYYIQLLDPNGVILGSGIIIRN